MAVCTLRGDDVMARSELCHGRDCSRCDPPLRIVAPAAIDVATAYRERAERGWRTSRILGGGITVTVTFNVEGAGPLGHPLLPIKPAASAKVPIVKRSDGSGGGMDDRRLSDGNGGAGVPIPALG